jgi:hypothetical protein
VSLASWAYGLINKPYVGLSFVLDSIIAMEPSDSASSLPYHEPDIITILVQTSFLLLLNIINAALDRVLYCGLLGQVLIGIAWGTPGAKWLSLSVEETMVQLGYLGLILLVYEGMSSLFSLDEFQSYASLLEEESDDVTPFW